MSAFDPSVCESPPGCEPAFVAWASCEGEPPPPPPPCESQSCAGGSDGSCECTGVCSGHVNRTSCDQAGYCTCFVDGVVDTHCNSFGTLACDLIEGCCGELWWNG